MKAAKRLKRTGLIERKLQLWVKEGVLSMIWNCTNIAGYLSNPIITSMEYLSTLEPRNVCVATVVVRVEDVVVVEITSTVVASVVGAD